MAGTPTGRRGKTSPVAGKPGKRDEHWLIKGLPAQIPEVIRTLDLESGESVALIHKSIDMIRFYADRYHHAKEEEILFMQNR